jgi:hypothetical protein
MPTAPAERGRVELSRLCRRATGPIVPVVRMLVTFRRLTYP